MSTPTLRFVAKTGAATRSLFGDLAALRITVFRDFPYLYEGNFEYEKDYLEVYARSEKSFVFAAYDGEKLVGATTCIPLSDEATEIREPFVAKAYNLDSVFYFGESIVLKEYRGVGLGHRFFDERENHARQFGSFELAAFCAVNRCDDHPLQPSDYRSNNAFWTKRGYRRDDSLIAYLSWTDLGEAASTAKKMTFWIKKL